MPLFHFILCAANEFLIYLYNPPSKICPKGWRPKGLEILFSEQNIVKIQRFYDKPLCLLLLFKSSSLNNWSQHCTFPKHFCKFSLNRMTLW